MNRWFPKLADFPGSRPLLWAILVAGFLLRVSGITWGIPLGPFEGWYHPDEHYVFDSAITARGLITDTDKLFYPTLFPHLLALLTLPVRIFVSPLGEQFNIIVALMGRFCSVLAGTGAIYLTYRLGREVASEGRALLASAFVAFSMYHAQSSAFGTTDVLMSFFLVLFLWLLHRAFQHPERTVLFVAAGVALGLLIGSKYPGVLAVAVVPLLLVHALVAGKRHSGSTAARPALLLRRLAVGGAVAVATFFITTPGPLLDIPAFLALMETLATRTGWSDTARSEGATWLVTYRSLTTALGWPLTWLFLIGLVWPAKRNIQQVSFVVLVLVFFLFFGAWFPARYVGSVVPVIALVAAESAAALYRLGSRFRMSWIAAALVAAVVVYSIGYSGLGAYSRHDDSRTEAARYLRAQFPAGTTLGIGYLSETLMLEEFPRWMNLPADSTRRPEPTKRWTLWRLPQVDFTHFRYEDALDYPEVLVLTDNEVAQMESALRSDRLQEGFVWDPRHAADWYWHWPPSPRVFAFYSRLLDSLNSPYRLVRTIRKPSPVPVEFGSPEIRVYAADSGVAEHRAPRSALSAQSVHFYPPLSRSATPYPDNPHGFFQEADVRARTWKLQAFEGSLAQVEFPPDDPGRIHIDIERVSQRVRWHVQLSRTNLPVRRAAPYRLSFRGRASALRQVGVGVGRTHGKWDDVGLYQSVNLTREWQEFRFDFEASADEDAARIFFDLGETDPDLELDQVRLHRRQPSGDLEEVVDRPLSYEISYRFDGLGCRGPGYSVPKPPGTTRVLLLGNSWALGAGVREPRTLSSRLQALLQAVSPGRQDVRVDVINCGANDYGEREARLFYEHMAAQYQPDLVLLLVAPPAHESPVDVVRVHTPRHLNLDPAAEAAARLARRGANRVLDAVASAAEIGRLSGAARARGGRLAVLLAQDRSDAGWTGFADSLAAMLRRTEIPLHPMKSLLPGTGNREGFLVYPGMDGHPNELAHDLAARETLAFLRQHGLLSGW